MQVWEGRGNRGDAEAGQAHAEATGVTSINYTLTVSDIKMDSISQASTIPHR
jgi:hypothetical protein